MRLKEILQKMNDEDQKFLLNNNGQNWEASDLLKELSEPNLNVQAYIQPGIYIAEISDRGYLGSVLYRLIEKD
jgi:hypothetical protein